MYESASFRLDGQVAVITGAGAGIGRAIAETFAAAGAAVMVSDLDSHAAGAVADAIEALGGKAAAWPVMSRKRRTWPCWCSKPFSDLAS